MRTSSTGVGLLLLGACLVGFAACSDATTADDQPPPATTTPPTPDAGDGTNDDASSSSEGGGPDASNARIVRIAAMNTTSGAATSYEPLESIRLFQGLKPDVVLLQEFRYKSGTDGEIRELVDTAFGSGFSFYREPGVTLNDIPNGIVSRYPIVASGSWDDPIADNRGFAWAKIEIPNAAHPLWAISVHLLTSSPANRDTEAAALVAKIEELVPPADYLVVGGDLNTSVRTETCITTLAAVLSTGASPPDDGAGNDNTNGPRNKPFDWLLVDPDLTALATPVAIGARAFPSGLVFDSRVYQPLSDVAPIQLGDSSALNMQHMPVVRDFAFPR